MDIRTVLIPLPHGYRSTAKPTNSALPTSRAHGLVPTSRARLVPTSRACTVPKLQRRERAAGCSLTPPLACPENAACPAASDRRVFRTRPAIEAPHLWCLVICADYDLPVRAKRRRVWPGASSDVAGESRPLIGAEHPFAGEQQQKPRPPHAPQSSRVTSHPGTNSRSNHHSNKWCYARSTPGIWGWGFNTPQSRAGASPQGVVSLLTRTSISFTSYAPARDARAAEDF